MKLKDDLADTLLEIACVLPLVALFVGLAWKVLQGFLK